MGTNDDGGIRCFYHAQRNWHVIKVYLPEIRVKPVYEFISGANTDNPIFRKRNISSWLNRDAAKNADVLINASYFKFDGDWSDVNSSYGPFGSRAKLPHALGYNNYLIASGYNSNEYGVRQLRINNRRACIEEPTLDNNYETLVVGLDPRLVGKDKNLSIGRTMVGSPWCGNDIIYFFVTGKDGGATQQEAIDALAAFGCDDYVMLDGSGSSQVAWNGSMLVESDDPFVLPHRRILIMLRINNR